MFNCYNTNCFRPTLIQNGNEQRERYTEEYYKCPECGETYTLRTNYKLQSKLIESQVMIRDLTGRIVE